MLAGIGTDIHEVARMQRELRKQDGGLRDAVFTSSEIGCCSAHRNPAQPYAACFAIKEAVLKALGTGWTGDLSWLDIQVDAVLSSTPRVTLSGATRLAAERLGVKSVQASVSQTSRLAMASVLLEA